MISVEEFKKLVRLEREGYWIFCDGEQVILNHDDIEDIEDCTFEFLDDQFAVVHDSEDEDEWTVMKPEWIDWKSI